MALLLMFIHTFAVMDELEPMDDHRGDFLALEEEIRSLTRQEQLNLQRAIDGDLRSAGDHSSKPLGTAQLGKFYVNNFYIVIVHSCYVQSGRIVWQPNTMKWTCASSVMPRKKQVCFGKYMLV